MKPSPRSRPRRATPTGAGALARSHRATRAAHASELAEDYVEIIDDLIASRGEARVVDIAACLGVTHVTVSRTLTRLRRDGLVTTVPYRSVFLTPGGRALARACKRRHDLIVAFLRSLGISRPTARADAEGIEHHVSRETLRAFARATPSPRRRAPKR
ncbi:MAG: manganese-binding transcriptional regulator MntR [Phycisphaerae bacterium]|nr:manganese-binding transcriptional regulator MntR [Phycisphaerae bacterium]